MNNTRKRGKEGAKDQVLLKEMDSQQLTDTDHVPSEIGNISLLLFLYILQGIPLGLSASIPMILQNKGVSYKDQATFSLALWPFSVKLLWAPLVDSLYWSSIGRRKSWLIPAQYLIGIFMLILSFNLELLLGDESSTVPPNVLLLTAIFFSLNFLAATQDIAVDGWALTMLSRQRIGWASTCNSVGQTAGFFLGYVVLLALESTDFCVNYLGLDGPVLSLKGYFYFWGIVFLITTSLVWLMKTETESSSSEESDGELHLNLLDTYKMLLTILNKKIIMKCIVFLLTCKIGFAAADSLTVLKMTEAGVPKDKLALLSVPITPVQIFLPLIISRFTAGPRPMDLFVKAVPYRLLLSLGFAGIVYITPSFKGADGVYPPHFYVFLVVFYVLHQITANCMFVAVMAFFARISDPAVGGTYMTLLNTFTNLGGNWPAWVALRYVSDLTWSACEGAKGSLDFFTCDNAQEKEACTAAGGSCNTIIDGYYLESVLCFMIGMGWLLWGSNAIRDLQSQPLQRWRVVQSSSKVNEHKQ